MRFIASVSISLTVVSEVYRNSYITVKDQGGPTETNDRSAARTPRRRRADAERSISVILDAAIRVLRDDVHASVEDIARRAGLSRQTVYAHFASRGALIAELLDRATQDVVAAVEAANPDEGSATNALLRLLDVSWEAFERYPFLFDLGRALADPVEDRERHVPVADLLERVVGRGQRAGEFDHSLSPTWLVAALTAVGHAAGDEVAAGRMTAAAAHKAATTSVLRILAPGR